MNHVDGPLVVVRLDALEDTAMLRREVPPDFSVAANAMADSATLAAATCPDSVLSPLRYPGGKRRLAPLIQSLLCEWDLAPDLFVEPFAGGASVSLHLLSLGLVQRVGLADVDPMITSFWETVFFDSEWLIEQIGSVELSLAQWQRFKTLTHGERRDLAIACLYLNRTSFSGIIAPGSGPLGGRSQTSKYKIGCRFPRKTLQTRIRNLSLFRDRIAFIATADWSDTVTQVKEAQANRAASSVMYYLDPPFFNKAQRLYRSWFTPSDHRALRDGLVGLDDPWVLSYDSVAEVERLYAGVGRKNLAVVYSAASTKNARTLSEALVSNYELPNALVPKP